MGKMDLRELFMTAVLVMLITAAVRVVAPRVPLLDRVAPYV